MDKKKLLIIVRLPPQATAAHEAVIASLKPLSNQDVTLAAVFFMDSAALLSISSQEESFLSIQMGYRSLSTQFAAPLLVCGTALRERGFCDLNLQKDFTISGNMELAMLCASSQVVEF